MSKKTVYYKKNSCIHQIKIKSKIINNNEEITLNAISPTNAIYDELGPHVIEIDLNGEYGFQYRQAAYRFVKNEPARGKESGNIKQQFIGKLAEYVVKDLIANSMEAENLGHDLKLKSNKKVDVKCRGGILPFKRTYSNENMKSNRETKHNFYARQIFDINIDYDADIYIMCHLKTSYFKNSSSLSDETKIIGTKRQRTWKLYICGWIPKTSVIDALFLPVGSLTESGNIWFPYKANEVEFYHKYLEPLWIKDSKLEPLSSLCIKDMNELIITVEGKKENLLHMTTVDRYRISCDLMALGIISEVPNDLISIWEPILHKNQYFHLCKFLSNNGVNVNLSRLNDILGEESSFK